MNKRVLALVLVMVLFLSVNVLALEKTRVHGNVSPGAGVTLKLTYYANGQVYTDQLVQKTADTWGNWEHKMSSDAGTIGLTVVAGGVEKSFEIPSGQDFEVKLTEEEPATPEVNESVNDSVDVAVVANEEPEKKSSFLSGLSIFGEGGSSTLGIVLILVGLFVVVLIANLVSHGIINLSGRRGEVDVSRPVNVVKLSDRLREQRDGREKDEQEIRRQREYIEQQNRKRAKEEQVRQLQEKLNELERDE